MAENYEYLYSGGSSTLDPTYGDLFTGYRLSAGSIGAPTSPQTADQIREVSSRLNEGMKSVELSVIQPEIFDTIPKQHLQEINRLSKLTGSETSVHAPIIDPAGFSKEGWSEVERQNAERQILSVVERSHELNPNGNIPVTIHSSGLPGAEYAQNLPVKREIQERIKRGELPPSAAEEAAMIAVNRETGQMEPLKLERRYYPERTGEQILTPREEIDMVNNSRWQNNLIQIEQFKKMSDDLRETALPVFRQYEIKVKSGIPLTPAEKGTYESARQKLMQSEHFLGDVEAAVRGYYSTAYKHSDPTMQIKTKEGKTVEVETRKILEVASEPWRDFRKRYEGGKFDSTADLVEAKAQAMRSLLDGLSEVRPNTFVPIEEFAIDKASTTLGNVAFDSFKKYGNSAPLISIENVPVGMAISRAEDLKKLIVESREKFVDNAVKNGISKSEARRQAEKLIGATWDVGHINLLRKGGFGKEKIIEETKKIAPYVKHVHLTDNFGFADTHLPIGMGEVPTKEMMKELEKAGYSGKQIVEAGGFVAQFKTSPHPYVLEALGSPLYSAYMQPFWNQVRGTSGNYSAGYGTMLPEQHFSMYGAGFTTLPTELGGQLPGKQSRFSGTPTE